MMTIEIDESSAEIKEQEIEKFFDLRIGNKDQFVIVEADHAIGQVGIKDIVRQVSQRNNATLMVAAKPREEVDVARRGSTEARKAMRWAYDKVMTKLGWFDVDKKPVKDIHRVCLNGIKDDRKLRYDVVIAASYSPASEDKLAKMQELLQEKMGDKYKVVLATSSGLGAENSGMASISDFRNERVYGDKFHTFQIGVSKRIRENDRPLFVDALLYSLQEIQK